MIDFKKRSGLSRLAKYENFTLPSIIFHNKINNENIIEKNWNKVKILNKEIELPSLKELQEIEIEDKILLRDDIVIIPGLITLEKRPKELIRKIFKARKDFGYRRIFYAPFIAKYLNLPILHYLGIDLLDDLRCSSNECSIELFNMEKMVLKAIEKNYFRVFVESIPDPLSKTLLRISDMDYFSTMEIFYPVTGSFLNASHFESLFRPDIQRWIKRITENYEKPYHEIYAFLIPCSATKPYSKSRSHRFFKSIIEQSGKHVHEIIVTSPLGIVPRELEFTYPAKNYDIPVTGYWYEDEKKMLIETMEKFFSKNKYRKILAYLPDDLAFLEPYLKKLNADYVIGNLRDEINVKRILDLLGSLENISINKNIFLADALNSIASFQFNEKFPLENKKIRRKFDEIFVYDDKETYLYFSPLNGNLLLYKKSAEYLMQKNKKIIEIDNFIPKGSIFAAGIINASDDIREGDEVIVHNNGRLIATGTALMSYKDMLEQGRGEAVKVRHTFTSS